MGNTPSASDFGPVSTGKSESLPNAVAANIAQFTVNGRTVVLPADLPTDTTLNEFLRNHLLLTGTKVMCREGGCGACVVTVRRPDTTTPTKMISMSVNSCLTPVLSCRDWQITTIEGIGASAAPHVIQERIATMHGTQCGYCTPGFCMQQHALMQQHPDDATKQRIEDAYDGNICRCTGFRPILDAMKSLASEQQRANNCCEGGRKKSEDIEDLADFLSQVRNVDKKQPFLYCPPNFPASKRAAAAAGDAPWAAPTTFDQLWKVLPAYAGKNIRFVAGHTGEGVYRDGPYDAYIDLKHIPELGIQTVAADRMEFGSLISLTTLIDVFELQGQQADGFAYLTRIAAHIRRVANTSVRNAGTWAGNLMLKKHHNDFPSDLFLCFAAVGAQLVLTSASGDAEPISLETFIAKTFSMNGKVLRSLILKTLPADTFFYSYKVTPREVNAHAHVNGAMVVKLDASKGGLIVGKPTLLFGNISSGFLHASATETLLGGGKMKLAEWNNNESPLMKAFETLRGEVHPTMEDLANVSVEYRRSLCCALLYKFLLAAAKQCKLIVNVKNDSAVERIERPLSSGMQSFGTDQMVRNGQTVPEFLEFVLEVLCVTDKKCQQICAFFRPQQWPVTKPIPKIEALIQATGEAQFVSDMMSPATPAGSGLHAVPIVALIGPALINSIDTSQAQKMNGFVRIVVAADIIGQNTVIPLSAISHFPQKLLASDGNVDYAGQPLGFVLADSEHAARACATAVRVHLTPTRKSITTCEDAIAANSFFDLHEPDVVRGDAPAALKSAPYSYKGRVHIGSQYHFHMETHVAVCEPQDNGTLVLNAATQWPDFTQTAAGLVCGMNVADIDVHVKRLGGGFGAKMSYASYIACMAALGAKLTKRSVKCHLSMYDNTRMFFGGRHSYLFEYEVGLNSDKKLQAIKLTSYCDVGNAATDYLYTFQRSGDNVYKCPNWLIHSVACKTDTPPKTYTRAPGTTEAVFIMEHIMERCAFELGMDPLEFRQLNFYQKSDMSLHNHPMTSFNLPEILNQLRSEADLQNRKTQVAAFNSANRWKKRGLSVVPIMYSHGYAGFTYASLITVHHGDGTVSVSYGAVDMGQGINTKVAQCVARELGVDMDKVRIKATTSIVAGNGFVTAGSVPSELAVRSCIEACKSINQRMMPVREKLGGSASWKDVVNKCYEQNVDLAERNWIVGAEHEAPLQNGDAYEICAAMTAEVEIDILTGERQIRRVDMVYDCGESVSPAVDIGQAEGAIVMGLGLYTSEEEKRNHETGELLSYNTWHYKPPSAKDIPVDMRITFLKNAPNKLGVLRSKAVGEPPLNAACAVVFAARQAMDEARREAAGQGQAVKWIDMDAPATCERVQQLCGIKNEQLKM